MSGPKGIEKTFDGSAKVSKVFDIEDQVSWEFGAEHGTSFDIRKGHPPHEHSSGGSPGRPRLIINETPERVHCGLRLTTRTLDPMTLAVPIGAEPVLSSALDAAALHLENGHATRGMK